MYECFVASLFFGTPFRGSDQASILSMLTMAGNSLPRMFSAETCTSLIDHMKPDNPLLDNLRGELKRLEVEMSPKMQFFYVFEETRTDLAAYVLPPSLQKSLGIFIPNNRQCLVTRESAVFEGGKKAGFARTHRELVSFEDTDCYAYRTTVNILDDMIKNAVHSVNARLSASRDSLVGPTAVRNILNCLSSVDMRQRRRMISRNTPLTKWIKEAAAYKPWKERTDTPDPSLVVSGKEGAGKTGAALAAISDLETVRTELTETIRIGYFLCSNEQFYNQPEDLLKSIIYQLIDQDAMLAVHARHFLSEEEQQDAKKENLARRDHNHQSNLERPERHLTPSLENLWICLLDILADSTCERTFIIISNIHLLDYTSANGSGEKFIELLKTIPSEQARQGTLHRWLFTTRTDTSTLAELTSAGASRIDMDNSVHQDQRRMVLEEYATTQLARLQEQKGYSLDFRYWAKNTICSKAPDSNWIDIACIQLQALPRSVNGNDQERDHLEQAPSNVTDMLTALWLPILTRKDSDSAAIKKMLRALVLAFRNPTEDELMILTDIRDRSRLRHLIEQCEPLLHTQDLDGLSTIVFKHETFKRHLLQDSKHLLHLKDGAALEREHGVLAWRCFSSIETVYAHERRLNASSQQKAESFDDEDEQPDEQIEQSSQDSDNNSHDTDGDSSSSVENDDETLVDDGREAIIQRRGIAYSIQFWFRHAGLADAVFSNELSKEHTFCGRRSTFRVGWLNDYRLLGNDFDDDELNFTGVEALHVAAAFGFDDLVDALRKNDRRFNVNVATDSGLTPVSLICSSALIRL